MCAAKQPTKRHVLRGQVDIATALPLPAVIQGGGGQPLITQALHASVIRQCIGGNLCRAFGTQFAVIGQSVTVDGDIFTGNKLTLVVDRSRHAGGDIICRIGAAVFALS